MDKDAPINLMSLPSMASERERVPSYPNGAVTTTSYDKASRVTNIWTNRSGSVLESFAYTFDKAGSRLSMTEANGSSANYRYDNLYRLLNESYSNGRSIGYTYDADGNRLTSREVRVGGSLVVTTYSYGKEDQLLKAVITGGATTTYTHDRDGNQKTSVTGSATTTYAYDIENRLTSVTTSSSTSTYGYSADGRRLKRVSGGTATYFGNDPMSPSGYDDTIEEYTSTGTKTATYLHGIGVDELLGYKTTAWYYYHGDALGSVTRATDSAGAMSSTYRYDAFGAIRAQSGISNTYGFTSRENEASLLYYRARYYDPSPGRFTSSDPSGMADGPNLYAYAGGNPVNRVDPSGRWFEGCSGWECHYGTGQPGGGGSSASSSGETGTYTSAYCDGWAVARGLCIPSNNAPDASLTSTSSSGSAPRGTCTNWGAVAAGVGLIALVVFFAVVATIFAPEIWLEPHVWIFFGGLVVMGLLAIGIGMNQQCS
ncbi:MAG TPA: RHS repeat-associated core domain-containing protein [Thermoplasmata archaeon]